MLKSGFDTLAKSRMRMTVYVKESGRRVRIFEMQRRMRRL